MERARNSLERVSAGLLPPQEILLANGGSFDRYRQLGLPLLSNIFEWVYKLPAGCNDELLYKEALSRYWCDYPSIDELDYFKRIREARAVGQNTWRELAKQTGFRPIPYLTGAIEKGAEIVLIEAIGLADERHNVRIYHQDDRAVVEVFTPRGYRRAS